MDVAQCDDLAAVLAALVFGPLGVGFRLLGCTLGLVYVAALGGLCGIGGCAIAFGGQTAKLAEFSGLVGEFA